MKGLKDITFSMRSLKWTSDDYIRLTLKRATINDTGTYGILAKNRYGCDWAFFTVKLRQRARSATPTRDNSYLFGLYNDSLTYLERQYLTGKFISNSY